MSGPLLVFEGVAKEYSPRRLGFLRPRPCPAVTDVDLTVDRGELLLIAGASGAGKSTLAHLMVGLIAPTRGRILFDGQETTPSSVRELAGRRQLVWQNPYRSLSPRLTVAETVREPAGLVGRTIDVGELLDTVGLDRRLADCRPGRLSAGQRQRAALARAISTRPDLIVFDEPTSALDPIAAQGINSLIADLSSSEMAVVLISHDPTMTALATRTIIIVDGRQIPAEIANQPLESAVSRD